MFGLCRPDPQRTTYLLHGVDLLVYGVSFVQQHVRHAVPFLEALGQASRVRNYLLNGERHFNCGTCETLIFQVEAATEINVPYKSQSLPTTIGFCLILRCLTLLGYAVLRRLIVSFAIAYIHAGARV